MKSSIEVNQITKAHLSRLSKHNESEDTIIMKLLINFLEDNINRDVNRMKKLCGLTKFNPKTAYQDIKNLFSIINFDYGIHPNWNLENIILLLGDETFKNSFLNKSNEEILLVDIAILCYYIYLGLPLPKNQ